MKVLKVLINRDPVVGPWGGGARFLEAFHSMARENGIEIVKTLQQSPDVIFIFHPDEEITTAGSISNGKAEVNMTIRGVSFDAALEHKRNHPDVQIIVRVNECDARKRTTGVDEKWMHMIQRSDHAFYVSKWMETYFDSRIQHVQKSSVIINGVDRSLFKRAKKISDVTGKVNIVCAHWSDNFFKGQDVYEFLDRFVRTHQDFTFTFIGRTKANLKHSHLVSALDPKDLALELSRYDVCVNGSRFDPGPNAVIESIAAGLPTYVHADGGGGVDFAGAEHAFKTLPELENILLSKNYPANPDIFRSWGDVMARVFDRIKSL